MTTSFNLGHEECRGRVCVCCYRKASRSLSQVEVGDIQKYLIEGYNVNDSEFPRMEYALDATLHYQRNTTTRIITWWFWRIMIQKENVVCVLYLRVDVCRICTVAKIGGGGVEYRRLLLKKKRGRAKGNTT